MSDRTRLPKGAQDTLVTSFMTILDENSANLAQVIVFIASNVDQLDEKHQLEILAVLQALSEDQRATFDPRGLRALERFQAMLTVKVGDKRTP